MYSCKACGENLENDLALFSHAHEHCNRHVRDCDDCDCVFVNRGAFYQHQQRKRETQTSAVAWIGCDRSRTVGRPSDATSLALVPFKCFLCTGKSFANRSDFCAHFGANHVRSVSHQTYDCDVCGEQFDKKWKRTDHMRNVHEIRIRPRKGSDHTDKNTERQKIVTSLRKNSL